MRMLFLSNYYPPFHRGGYEELCQDVALQMSQRGHAISILTSHTGSGHIDQNDIPVYRFLHPEVYPGSYLSSLGYFFGRSNRLKENLETFQEIVFGKKIDIVLVWGMWNLSRSLLETVESWSQPKIAYYIADLWPSLPDAYTLHWSAPSSRRLTRKLKEWMGKMVVGEMRNDPPPALKFENVFCVSQAVRSKLIQEGFIPPSAKVVYNGIDLQEFPFYPRSHRRFDSDSPLRLLYAGRLVPEKGVHLAIHLLGKLKCLGIPSKLSILGSGNLKYQGELTQLSKDLDIDTHVTFLQHVPRKQMHDLLPEHDMLLVPSLVYEGLPRILQEAMAVGLVVAAIASGGIGEIIEDGINGILFSFDDLDILATKIIQLIQSPDRFQEISFLGRKTIEERFDIQKTTSNIEFELHRLVENSL